MVVDAAVAIQKRGADVTIFTSRHDRGRCFEETRDGMAVAGHGVRSRRAS